MYIFIFMYIYLNIALYWNMYLRCKDFLKRELGQYSCNLLLQNGQMLTCILKTTVPQSPSSWDSAMNIPVGLHLHLHL